MNLRAYGLALLTLPLLGGLAQATTYQVGPTRTYQQPSQVRALLMPGDLVEIDGDHTYAGGLIFDEAGSPASKITIRGLRVNGKRPVISGGGNAIEARASHYVFEGLDITAGTNRCFYHHADDITLRDSVVHDCPAQGILGADTDSGSLLLEYTEVHHCGEGTQNHQIYMSTDASIYADAVFRMQHCYLHDGNGGNNVKSRAARNELFYNWIEGALYHEVELIGSEENPEALVREDSDVVGNVLIKRNPDSFVVRFGGDGTGQTNGRYRFVNNTVIVLPDAPAVFRCFDGIESLEAHNNVFAVRGAGNVNLLREVEASWVSGTTTIAGQNNWIQSGATNVPTGFTGTITGSAPGFVDLVADDLRPATASPLVDAGAANLSGPAGHAFPDPLPAPLYLPPSRSALAVGTAEGRNTVGTIDVGAFELGGGGAPPPDGGTSTSDGGIGASDGGVGAGDGGTVDSPDGGASSDESGGCDHAPGGGGSLGAVLLFALFVGLSLRRGRA